MAFDPEEVRHLKRPHGLPFRIAKLGHVVLNVSDLPRSVAFYTGLLGFEVSDTYPEAMMPGGMVFMRCNADHHGVALVGSLPGASASSELNHLAFEVATVDEVVRARATISALMASPSISKDAAAPAARSPSSSVTPMATVWRSIGASTRSAVTAERGPPPNGKAREASPRRSPIRWAARTRRCTTRRCCGKADSAWQLWRRTIASAVHDRYAGPV